MASKNSKAPPHTATLRIAGSAKVDWYRDLGGRRYAAKNEAECKTCVDCGKPALYRLYTPRGVNIGACAEHRQGLFKKAGWK